MAEGSENLDNLLAWTRYKLQKSLVEALSRYDKLEKKKKKENAVSLLENDSRKNTRAVIVGSLARLNQTQNYS